MFAKNGCTTGHFLNMPLTAIRLECYSKKNIHVIEAQPTNTRRESHGEVEESSLGRQISLVPERQNAVTFIETRL